MIAPASLALVEHRDAAVWDKLVGTLPGGSLLQSWDWGEFKGRFGWRPLRLALSSGDATATAQLLIRPTYGLAAAYVPRGPLLAADDEVNRALLRSLRSVARRRRAAFLRLEPNIVEGTSEANALHSLLQVEGFEPAEPLQPRSSIRLDLRSTPAELLAGASKGHRADVRRAERNGVQVRIGQTDSDLDAFYAIMLATAERQQFAIHDREYYMLAWRMFGDAARLLLADLAGETVAAFLVFGWGREAQYMYSGSNELGLKAGANHLLQWHAIVWANERGCEVYDMWGVPDAFGRMAGAELSASPKVEGHELALLEAEAKANPMYGVYRFKKGWGGRVVRYLPAYDQVYLRPAYNWWRRRATG